MAASISHFLSAITKINVVLPTKKNVSFFFFFSFAGLPPTFSFSLSGFLLYIPNLWSKLNTLDNTDTETISTFRSRLYWRFSCLCITRREWLCDCPPKYPRVAFGLPYLLIELFYNGMPVGADGQALGRCTGEGGRPYKIEDQHIFFKVLWKVDQSRQRDSKESHFKSLTQKSQEEQPFWNVGHSRVKINPTTTHLEDSRINTIRHLNKIALYAKNYGANAPRKKFKYPP